MCIILGMYTWQLNGEAVVTQSTWVSARANMLRLLQGRNKHDNSHYIVTNHLDTDSPPEVTRSPHCPLHHTTAAYHPRTAFPIHHCTDHICHQSLIALITQLALITHYKSLELLLSHCWVLFRHFQSVWAFFPVYICRWLTGLFTCFWPFAACLFDPACLLISSLSAACPDLCIAPVDDSALPSLHLFSLLNFACLTSSWVLWIKLHLDLNSPDPFSLHIYII